MTNYSDAFSAALKVAQQAVWVLAKSAGVNLSHECHYPEDCNIVQQAKKIVSPKNEDIFWSKDKNISITHLPLLFDQVQLLQGQMVNHFWPATYIKGSNPQIPYPRKGEPITREIDFLKQRIKRTLTLEGLNGESWKNLSLLTLILEKFGSYISFNGSDVALVDMVRSTGAVAAALANHPEADKISLIAGDLSGIQKFIYTISSDGALKSLRARSFYLELVTEEVVQQILEKLKLPRTNIIYAGGGNLYLLANATKKTKDAIEEVRLTLNEWLWEQFQGKVFLALDYLTFDVRDISDRQFADRWSEVTKQLQKQKARKFAEQMEKVLAIYASHEPCRVCHRDDVEPGKLKQLNKDESDSVLACKTCRDMFKLGGELLQVQAIVRSPDRDTLPSAADRLCFKLPDRQIYYHIFKRRRPLKELVKIIDSETVFLVNDWMIYRYRTNNVVPLLLGNYARESEDEPNCIMSAGEMVKKAKGMARVGYLRMDVDRLGQIFARGLGDNQTLPRLAGLSRQMSYFFKVYLNSLAAARKDNFPKKVKKLTEDERLNLLFIYAGGDDLFVSGAWNEVVEFAFDVYQCFRAYTGDNPDITLSGGISIDGAKFPLYQAAKGSGKAEDAAKENGRDSLGLFGQVFKWGEWLGTEDNLVIDSKIREYLQPEIMPKLFGVLPFVERLDKEQIGINYARSFVRNLLITAEMQEQMVKEFKDKYSKDALGVQYYLHLPKIAYTLSRLPSNVLDDFDFRTSLKSPYNAPYFRAIATWIELLNRSNQEK